MSTDTGYLPLLHSREKYVDHLEGISPPELDEEGGARPQRTLVKTYMLETARYGQTIPDLDSLFPGNVQLHRLDDTLYRVQDSTHGNAVVGLLEALNDRHPVLYTTLGVDQSNKWVRQVVDRSPWLDHLWLSSPILFELWNYVRAYTPAHRYIRLGFEHDAWYEASSDVNKGSEAQAGVPVLSDSDADTATSWVERRRSRVTLTERLALLTTKLDRLMELYDPLHSLVHLQVPSGGHGGHRFFYDGRCTNWSDSFVEHRSTVSVVLRMYRKVTERAEARLWVDSTNVGEDGYSLRGAPVTIRFHEPLSEATFKRFVDLALRRQTSRLRIGGYVTSRGPTKVHMAGIDRHLWQPFLLEATNRHLLVVLPRGTCGNTIHRLVTNVQRFVDPRVRVWLGSEPYERTVADSMKAA